jgi:DNA-binding NtrC family response regulator
VADILIVDDEPSVAEAFTRFLRFEGHSARVAGSGEDALAQLDFAIPDLVVMDVRMPGMSGLQTLDEMRRRCPDLYVIIMTAFGTSQTSIDAIRAGAFDYLTKPLDLGQLRLVINKALSSQRVRQTLEPTAQGASPAPTILVGESPQMLEVYKLIGRLSSNDVPALVRGERGTGKDLVVATVHNNSARRDQPLLVVACPTIGDDDLDAMVGTEGGTVHLRDVEHLSAGPQARLARALASHGMRGADRPLTARVIASTAADLSDAVRAGTFNAELYEFLSVITLTMPPLRDRRRDIALLARTFVRRFGDELGRSIAGIEDEAIDALTEYAWPGNVAELEHAIKRACVVASGDVITRNDVAESLTSARTVAGGGAAGTLEEVVRRVLQDRLALTHQSGSAFHDIVTQVEEALVNEALQITRGNQVKASELLGLNRATLRKKAGLTDSGA